MLERKIGMGQGSEKELWVFDVACSILTPLSVAQLPPPALPCWLLGLSTAKLPLNSFPCPRCSCSMHSRSFLKVSLIMQQAAALLGRRKSVEVKLFLKRILLICSWPYQCPPRLLALLWGLSKS